MGNTSSVGHTDTHTSLGRLWQGDLLEVKASLNYTVRLTQKKKVFKEESADNALF